jgi:hypothetical protein
MSLGNWHGSKKAKSIRREKRRVVNETAADVKRAPLSWPPAYVPQEHTPAERAAKVALIKVLAEDLGAPGKGNFGATLESIVEHASALLRDEAVRTGRGFKGPKGGC